MAFTLDQKFKMLNAFLMGGYLTTFILLAILAYYLGAREGRIEARLAALEAARRDCDGNRYTDEVCAEEGVDEKSGLFSLVEDMA